MSLGVSREDVLHVAALARLHLEEAEAERLTRQLNDILGHMETLQAVGDEAPGSAPLLTVARAPLRPDERAPDPLARPLSALAPAWRDGLFTLPRLAALDADALDETPAPGPADTP